MAASEIVMANQATQISGVIVIFAVVYAIFYRPVLSMLGERPSGSSPGGETSAEDEDMTQAIQPAAQGASDATVGPTTPWYRDRLLPLAVGGVLLVDQVSKYLVRANLDLYESWPRDGLLRLTHGINTGTAFGLFPNQTVVLIVISFFAIGFLFYFYRSQALPSRLMRLAIGLQLGGAFGNLVDRLRAGAVVDFIDVGWWPVFNLADSSIVIGIGLLLLAVSLSKDMPQKQSSDGRVGLEE